MKFQNLEALAVRTPAIVFTGIVIAAVIATVIATVFAALDAGAGPTVEPPPSSATPVAARFLNADGAEVAVEPDGGWVLTLELGVRSGTRLRLGATDGSVPRWTPEAGGADFGLLAFGDDQECSSWEDWPLVDAAGRPVTPEDPALFTPSRPNAWWPSGCRWVEVTPGLHLPAPGECGDRPVLRVFDDESGTNRGREEIGPCVGSADDGYGYGPNPRLPGLVVVADAGPGVVTDEDFDPPSVATRRNLAGFFQSVGYDLIDAGGGTRVVAHLNVPPGLLAPVLLADEKLDPEGLFGSGGLFGDCSFPVVRVDGGLPACGYPVPGEHPVAVRAFLVHGEAPATLADEDRDGAVTIADAVAAGLRVLSDEAVFRFVLHSYSDAYSERHYRDFDGDGEAVADDPITQGPGALTDPPR